MRVVRLHAALWWVGSVVLGWVGGALHCCARRTTRGATRNKVGTAIARWKRSGGSGAALGVHRGGGA